MKLLLLNDIPDEPRERTSVTMTQSTWAKARTLLVVCNAERKAAGHRALGRDEFIELCARWAFAELEAGKKPKKS